MKFIDLQRRFRDLTASELEDPELLVALSESSLIKQAAWDDLLQHTRVVLLAEAGSGKTSEMREQAHRLRASGQAAFFVPIEALDREQLTDLFSDQDIRLFAAWKADDSAVAWFFLDAVDELKLSDGRLDRALRRVAKAVSGLLHRVRIVISCRPSDWRSFGDSATLLEILPIVRPIRAIPPADEVFLDALRREGEKTKPNADESSQPDQVRPVVLLPMNRTQINLFAAALDVSDPVALISEIASRDAWTFARRPFDLSELVATWKQRGRLGTKEEQHEANITYRLRDDPDRHDGGVLSDQRLRLGAERLALALTLTRVRTIRDAEQTIEVKEAAGVLDPSVVLPDWSEKERQTLLRRAMFDPATYGRVRFHHSSIQEYLAARRLKALRDRGLSTKRLFRLIFADKYGAQVVIPSMRPIAAWLALWDERVRHELIRREPETLLSMGDPEALPISIRAQVLKAFAQAYGKGGWRGLRIPIEEIRRLAHSELASVVRQIWVESAANEDVRELLLQLIEQGAIEECGELADFAAGDPELPEHHRIIAIRAILACKRYDSAREIATSILNEPASWPDSLVAYVVDDLFPSTLSTAEVITLVERITDENARSVLARALRSIASTIDPSSSAAVELRNQLAAVLWQGREPDSGWHRMDGKYNHVASALVLLCERQLASHAVPDSALLSASVIAAKFAEADSFARGSLSNLRGRFAENVRLREAAFWQQLAFADRLAGDGTPSERSRIAQYHGLVTKFEQFDRSWLQRAMADSQAGLDQRLVAMHGLRVLWAESGRTEELLAPIREISKDHTALRDQLSVWLAPAPEDPELQEMERELECRRLEAREREERRLVEWQKWRMELSADPEAAFSPSQSARTIGLIYHWLQSRDRHSNRLNAWNRDALVGAFGDEVAKRADIAFRQFWRTQKPPQWSERPEDERNKIDTRWNWALSGLAAEAVNPAWAKGLTEQEAQTAAACATVELNGFPAWLPELVASHPSAVDEVLGTELTRELMVAAVHVHLPVFQNVAYSDAALKRLLAPRVIAAILAWPNTFESEEAAQRSERHLQQAIRVVDDATGAPEHMQLAAECEKRIAADPLGPLATVWLRGLFRLAPSRGGTVLRQAIEAAPNPGRESYALRVLATLFGEREGLLLDGLRDADGVDTLVDLINLSYGYVRPEDDQHHDGVYSADTRDRAQMAREFLLSVLLETPGPHAQRALLQLADGLLSSYAPDRIRRLAHERAAKDADSPALEASDVPSLEERYETPPVDRDGLFELVLDRLDDFQHDITDHDFTNRRTLQTITEEAEMQRTVALRLEDTSRGAYVVTRESEVADRKEPDIRVYAVRGSEKVSIELKNSDSWSVVDLEVALRTQLVGQYLRHETGRAGCLLLTFAGRKKYWEEPLTGLHLSFHDVVEHLAKQARSIERDGNYAVRIAVVGLDLTDSIAALSR